MANEFTKLTEKEVVESVSENGHLFAEDGGKIVRVPAAGVGGSGAVKAVITQSADDAFELASGSYAELSAAYANGDFPDIVLKTVDSGHARCIAMCDYGDSMKVAFYINVSTWDLLIDSSNNVTYNVPA